nr:MAG TPA: hypothetical protein [Caudoviricetes sp.]
MSNHMNRFYYYRGTLSKVRTKDKKEPKEPIRNRYISLDPIRGRYLSWLILVLGLIYVSHNFIIGD